MSGQTTPETLAPGGINFCRPEAITQKEPDMPFAPPVHTDDIIAALRPTHQKDLDKIASLRNQIEIARENPLSNVDAIHGLYSAMDEAFEYGKKILNTPNYIPAWLVKDAEFLVLTYHRYRLKAENPYRYSWVHAQKIKSQRIGRVGSSDEFRLTLPPINASEIKENDPRIIEITTCWGSLSHEAFNLSGNGMVKVISASGMKQSRIETGILILPFSGENLTRHTKIREMAENLQSVFTDNFIATLCKSFEARKNMKNLQENSAALRIKISSEIRKTEDFREISEMILPDTSPAFLEKIAQTCSTKSRSSIDFKKSENPQIRERHEQLDNIINKIAEMPDEHDAAILWIGISNGNWSIN